MRIITKRLFATAQTGTKPYSVLYFGSDEFSRITLASMLDNQKYKEIIKRLAVVGPSAGSTNSASDLFHKFARERMIEKHTFRKQFSAVEKYIKSQADSDNYPFDLAIIGSFPNKIPIKILNLFQSGVIVAHPSFLPKYRGLSPIEHTVMNSEKKGGVSIVQAINGTMTSSRIISQKECVIDPNDGYMQLAHKYGEMAGGMLVDTIDNLEESLKNSKEQVDSDEYIKAPLITKEQAIFLWDKLTVDKAVRKQMALFGSSLPGFTKLKVKNEWHYVYFSQLMPETNKSTDYYKKILAPVETDAFPGAIHWNLKGEHNKISIRCADGWVSTSQIKTENSRGNTIQSFITKQLRNTHYNENKKFIYKFADSKDIITYEKKVVI